MEHPGTSAAAIHSGTRDVSSSAMLALSARERREPSAAAIVEAKKTLREKVGLARIVIGCATVILHMRAGQDY